MNWMNAISSTRPRRRIRSWGRRILIDTPDRLKELIELMQIGLPSNMRISVQEGHPSASCECRRELAGRTAMVTPVAFQPNVGKCNAVSTPEPFLVEVRASLIVNETLGWMLPVYFCIGELLTAHELVTKVHDAFKILECWSQARTPDEATWAELPAASHHIQ